MKKQNGVNTLKKRTKLQKCADYHDAYKAIREGKPVKRYGRKDGSIATHPIIPCYDHPEKEVLKQCLFWLGRKRIFCNRMNVGVGDMGTGHIYSYGIRGAGDIMGLLPNGRHFEIECKRGKGGRLSFAQQQRKENIKGNCGIYLIVHGIEELEYMNKMYHYFNRDSLEGVE